jgi:hypothetical protein
MNSFLKYGLIFAGGVTAGVIASMAVNRGCINLKPVASGIISRGLDVKDAIANAVEKAKEDAQDLMAEARAEQADRKAAEA